MKLGIYCEDGQWGWRIMYEGRTFMFKGIASGGFGYKSREDAQQGAINAGWFITLDGDVFPREISFVGFG